LVCTQCMQSFMCTQKKMAEQHAESKHSKVDKLVCFPMLADDAMCTPAAAPTAKAKAKNQC